MCYQDGHPAVGTVVLCLWMGVGSLYPLVLWGSVCQAGGNSLRTECCSSDYSQRWGQEEWHLCSSGAWYRQAALVWLLRTRPPPGHSAWVTGVRQPSQDTRVPSQHFCNKSFRSWMDGCQSVWRKPACRHERPTEHSAGVRSRLRHLRFSSCPDSKSSFSCAVTYLPSS